MSLTPESMDALSQVRLGGTFSLGEGLETYGELTFAGPDTTLHLRHETPFDSERPDFAFVHGTLHDLTRVTLLRCLMLSTGRTSRRGGDSFCETTLFPHYVLRGDRHVAHDQKVVTAIHFVVDDAAALYYDFDAFGRVSGARQHIDTLIQANGLDREVPVGPDPEIFYFTGKCEIFGVDTVLGRVSATHNPSFSFPGPRGISLQNTLLTNIEFATPCSVDEAIARLLAVQRFLEIIIGRAQVLSRVDLRVLTDDGQACLLNLYWSMRANRPVSSEKEKPQPADLLINAGFQPLIFGPVLSQWIARNPEWEEARSRLVDSLSQRHYDIDRLIRSANMFDILPASAVPPDALLSDELIAARDQCRAIFRPLPDGPERQSVLGALGRVGKHSLKGKVRHRAQIVLEATGARFRDLDVACTEAVNCRNHYVHGSPSRIDFRANLDLLSFLSDTLEFVFAASDLIEAGWDIEAWCATPTSMTHPFGRFRVAYPKAIGVLLSLLPARAPSQSLAPEA